MASSKNALQRCHLLELPPELRNQIYGYLSNVDETRYAHAVTDISYASYGRRSHELVGRSEPKP